jgi:hypothetical protein
MDFRSIAAAAVMSTLLGLTGCDSGDRPSQVQAPEGSAPATTPADTATGMENESAQDRGGDQVASDLLDADEPTTNEPAGVEPGMSAEGTEGDVAMTEFAALDTDADGKVVEQEWQPDALSGLDFSQLDADGSGDISRDEFRQAVASSMDRTQVPDVTPEP